MKHTTRDNKPAAAPPPPSASNPDVTSEAVSPCLDDNLRVLENTFACCQDLTIVHWNYGPELRQTAFSVHFNTLTKASPANPFKDDLNKLAASEAQSESSMALLVEYGADYWERHGFISNSADWIDDIRQAVSAVLDGKVVHFINGWSKAVAYPALDIERRQPSEPVTEPTVQGPHVGFTETLDRNLGVIRSLLKSPRLKLEYVTAGAESKRTVSYGYMDSVVKPELLERFKQRLACIGDAEILDVTYLEGWIGDNRYSPFPQVRYTERPDAVVAALLDGKIVAMVNGSPNALICPVTFIEFLMTSEDYYTRTIYSSLIRLIRIAAFIIALLLPSTYIALSTFHSELIPTVLLLAILNTREGIPFPAMLEALIMEFFFELLREAGIRLPRPIGSAVSIVGALVIGQAAIQSQIASPVMVIVVALTGIASFALPQYNMAIAVRILRFPLMFLAATFGGLGIMVGFTLIFLHLATLRSLGQPYLASLSPLDVRRMREAIIIMPRHMQARSQRERHATKQTPERKKSP